MAAKNLFTLDEFKEYKGIANPENDDQITSLIARVSEFVKRYCGKTFVDYATTNKVEYFDGFEESVFVDEYPIIKMVSVSTSSDGGATYDGTLTEYTDYFVEYSTGEITSALSSFLTSSSVAAGKSKRTLKIIYNGGYKKLPLDIKQAAMDLLEYYREAEYTPRKDFQGFSLENLGFRTGDSSSLPSHIKRVLDAYREL